MSADPKRIAAYEKGLMGEEIAAQYLRGKGFDILAVRYKTRFGEIDLVAQDGEFLVAVEVKMRGDITSALEAVTYRNRRRVEQALLAYMADYPQYAEAALRFDVVAIASLLEIHHLDNAWLAGA
jgi:putative endonuclease